MNLEQVLELVIQRIRNGSLENEAQVKQAVIVPILRALEWDDADPAEFVPEYSVDNGRVDYALLGQTGPLVFIEAKGIGRVDLAGEEQLFRYAVNKGVPFLVLTDGDLWDFYLSMAAGVPAERRFYRAELTRVERVAEHARFLGKHLRKRRVVSGDARRAAEELHESSQEREKAREAMPGVWRSMLARPDDMLRDLLMEQVASECGTMPEQDDVESFLKACLSGEVPEVPDAPAPATRPRQRKSSPEPQQETSGGDSENHRVHLREQNRGDRGRLPYSGRGVEGVPSARSQLHGAFRGEDRWARRRRLVARNPAGSLPIQA